MKQYIDKSAVVAEIKRRISLFKKEKKTEKWSAGASQMNVVILCARIAMLEEILSFLDTLEVKEVDETAEEFARIIRANLTGINKDVQYKFEQLYKKITGEKMYQGYKD